MKSFIVLMLTCMASVSAYATPIPFDPTTSIDGVDGAQFDDALFDGVRFGDVLVDTAIAIDQWDDPQALVAAIELNPGAVDIVFRHLPRDTKYCQSGRMNAWRFNGNCFADDHGPQSVPEPGTLVLLAAGLFLLALTHRRRWHQAAVGR